ncbi:pyridoxal-phosphate-dependent aminotransferase family protein [Salidesulfovibrio onnuriiensis]|uniref:pyridoxal-phosphate-dependent aminotransferase family protein n=1 Tax=Salidesulfovibrio onnuriiensis TaxID=2583823 RepID=UPI0011C75E69|nr:aminotransferase class V-fold PLP-dependent enzyme [Salidesulfovibrio onnuriiensis]
MKTSDFADLKMFITGPTMIRKEVRQAGALPEFGHRDKENDKRCVSIFRNLRKIAGVPEGYEVFLINGSGSTCMEASIRSLVRDDETVLNISVGAFGDLYHNISKNNGKQAEMLRFDNGSAVELCRVREALERVRPAVVTVTHNETSTGVLNNITAVCELARKHGALPLVDGVSIFGGMDLDLPQARPAMYCTATQKCLALPAGFGIGFVAKEALDKAETVPVRGHTSDIIRQVGKARSLQSLTTPNTTLLNQMAVQLDYIVNEEGIENRFARHAKMQAMVENWVRKQDGFELFAQEGYRSPVMTAVRVPEGISFAVLKDVLKERMRERGYLFDPGYGKLNKEMEAAGERPIFRIGHMGDITPDMVEEYLEELGEELGRL